jgi:2-oxoglutarate dehydrogenase E2 component (dihydrolipoamide succinyltransferase)
MAPRVELKAPDFGESVSEAEVGDWNYKPGDFVALDAAIVELASDKATLPLNAPVAGTLVEIVKKTGEIIGKDDVLGYLEPGEAPAGSKSDGSSASAGSASKSESSSNGDRGGTVVMPAAERLASEQGVKLSDVQASGPGGRVLKEDVQRHLDKAPAAVASTSQALAPQAPSVPMAGSPGREEEVVPMTLIRRRIAERLVQAQHNAALLTTFNEVDMTRVMEMRSIYKDVFLQKYGIKLGFMSFFVKAVVEALKTTPAINAEIRGSDIVYKYYYDIGIAVGGGKGLVVPVLRNAERLGFAEIEQTIGDFAARAKSGKLAPSELQGGTFTISNGGVYGSLLSTPIINPPQSGILGLHAIQERPIAVKGQVVIRPMMYVALSYDHRLVDGREAVTFLKGIKDVIEDPSRILLEL